jgi:hypothetical protein
MEVSLLVNALHQSHPASDSGQLDCHGDLGQRHQQVVADKVLNGKYMAQFAMVLFALLLDPKW